jgi:hypothetical protein
LSFGPLELGPTRSPPGVVVQLGAKASLHVRCSSNASGHARRSVSKTTRMPFAKKVALIVGVQGRRVRVPDVPDVAASIVSGSALSTFASPSAMR